MRANSIAQLATKPIKAGQGLYTSNRAWYAVDVSDNERHIYHYRTHMVVIRNGDYYQVSEGWNSQTDKVGLGKIRKALGVHAPWGITQDLDTTIMVG